MDQGPQTLRACWRKRKRHIPVVVFVLVGCSIAHDTDYQYGGRKAILLVLPDFLLSASKRAQLPPNATILGMLSSIRFADDR